MADGYIEEFEQEFNTEEEESIRQRIEADTFEETVSNAQSELDGQQKLFSDIGNEAASHIVELKTSISEISKVPAEKKEEVANQIADQVNELQNLDNQQKVIGGSAFQPVKSHKKSGIGFGRWLLRGIGLPIAGILGVVAGLCTGIGALGYCIYNKIRWSGKLKNAQETMKKGLPGLDVEDDMEREDVSALEDDQEIIGDVRRIPLVWEKMIPENPKQKPYLLVKVKKGEGTDPGHVFLSLCYSRMNGLKNKMERYNAQFGFYPKDKFLTYISTMLKSSQTSMVIPGMLIDDSTHSYDLSKKYTVNNKQINQILTEAETYERGGYSLINRNCTTFVAEVTKNAGVPTDHIFVKSAFKLIDPLWIADKSGFGRMLLPLANQIFKDTMMQETQEDDFSYNRFGQKSVTKEDIERIEQTSKLSSMVGYSPDVVADAMEAEGISTLNMKSDTKTLESLQQDFLTYTGAFTGAIKDLIDTIPELQEVWSSFYEEEFSGEYQKYVMNAMEEDKMTAENMRMANEAIDAIREKVSGWFIKVLGRDARINPVISDYMMKLSSLQDDLWNKYNQKTMSETNEDSDLFYHMKSLFVKQGIGRGTISPAMLSASVRMYKNMQTAITDIRKLQAVKNLVKEGKLKNNDKEFVKLEQKEDTLNDFARAERYYLTKKTFTQKDADYAFYDLVKQESEVDDILENETSKIYQAFALEKVFGGLKPVVAEQLNKSVDSMELMERIYEYMSACLLVEEKAAKMKMILLSMHRNQNFGSKQDAVDAVERLFGDVYLEKAVTRGLSEVQDSGMQINGDDILSYVCYYIFKGREKISHEKEFARLIGVIYEQIGLS